MNITEKDCNDHFNKAKKALKTSFFSLKFSPDYTQAIDEFTIAAKGYKHLNKFQNSIESFEQASKCNKKITDYFSAGQNLLEISDIYFFNLSNIEQGISYLKQAVKNYQMSGKFSNSIKIITDIALKFMSLNQLQQAEKILILAYDECLSHSEEKLVRIAFEDVFHKLLDVQCGMKKYIDAIKMTEKYVDEQIKLDEDKYKINKNLMKLGILRIIIDEDYKLDEIIGKMYQNKYEDTTEDAADLRKLNNAIKKSIKKDFSYCVSSAFTLFENNLLKGLQDVYKKYEEENKNNPDNIVINDKRVININPDQKVVTSELESNKNNNVFNKEINLSNNNNINNKNNNNNDNNNNNNDNNNINENEINTNSESNNNNNESNNNNNENNNNELNNNNNNNINNNEMNDLL